ncbi:hypothetical protein L3X38_013943 [Prunus dulcis]|uniref:Uncharacterized protein n=1 Tax=Prunus dulcis TaxID=3755 RepID=A0AAD4WME2_PRUDU|nr:hypothetical protein L3X38_013943 [Prunus dulcis]
MTWRITDQSETRIAFYPLCKCKSKTPIYTQPWAHKFHASSSHGNAPQQDFENLDDAASAIDDYTPGKLRIIDFSASPDQQVR